MQNKDLFDFFGSDTKFFKDARSSAEDDAFLKDQSGKQVFARPGRGYQGTITDRNLDTNTYSVSLSIGDGISTRSGVGRIVQDPGDKCILPIGTRVALNEDYGELFIVGVLPYTTGREENENSLSLTGEDGVGRNDPLEQGSPSTANFRTKNTPVDMGPDDWARIGEDGNAIAVLAGGVTLMKSNMAQFRTHLINDLAEIICRNYRHISDMGTTQIKNDGGRITWSFRGGADQLEEAGSDQENWTIRIDLGAEGDLFRFELTQPNGQTNFKFHVNNEGRLEVYAADGIDEFSGNDKRSTVLSNRIAKIKGNDQETVEGSAEKTIQGNKTQVISNTEEKTVGNDQVINVQRNRIDTVGGKVEERIAGGNPLIILPGDLAKESILNGTWNIDIGNPLNGANPAALPGFDLNTHTGDIINKIKVAGNLNYSTLLGNATLETTAGIATLKTALGVANVDGTTVNLGPVAPSFANPIIKGTMHTAAMTTYTGANITAITPALAATTALLGVLAPPFGPITWIAGPVMAPAFAAWASAILACLTSLIASNTALAAALPPTLSTKSFTA